MICAVLAFCAPIACAQDFAKLRNPTPIGLILSVKCPGLLDSQQLGERVRIDDVHDRGRPLYVGDEVRCDGSGTLTFWIGTERVIDSSKGWVSLEGEVVSDAQQAKQLAISKELEETGKNRATRGETSTLFWPSASGRVRPETFSVRWNPEQSGGGTVSISVWEVGGNKVCCDPQLTADGSSGVLNSSLLRKVLTSMRNTRAQLPLELRFVCNAIEVSVRFSIFSQDDESLLEQQLARWETEPSPLVRHLGRAHVFSSIGLMVEAADEVDSLLQEVDAPSKYLIQEAIDMHLRAGDTTGVNQLKKRLSDSIYRLRVC